MLGAREMMLFRMLHILYDFLGTVKAASHECIIRTGHVQPASFLYHLAQLPQYRRKTHYLVLKTPE